MELDEPRTAYVYSVSVSSQCVYIVLWSQDPSSLLSPDWGTEGVTFHLSSLQLLNSFDKQAGRHENVAEFLS